MICCVFCVTLKLRSARPTKPLVSFKNRLLSILITWPEITKGKNAARINLFSAKKAKLFSLRSLLGVATFQKFLATFAHPLRRPKAAAPVVSGVEPRFLPLKLLEFKSVSRKNLLFLWFPGFI